MIWPNDFEPGRLPPGQFNSILTAKGYGTSCSTAHISAWYAAKWFKIQKKVDNLVKKKYFFFNQCKCSSRGVKNIELRKAQLFLAFASILTILLHYILYSTARHVHFEFMHKVKKTGILCIKNGGLIFLFKKSWALDFNSKLLPPAMCTFQNVLEILGVYIRNCG